ncbi:unnamed protein product [Ceutorhynchus assimilis]|uniref:Uncharacterized protein n=1 Tax=Ceutorhynchus assimilis TaxID=467358 RepID=A0A9N9MJC4_9CUCU|nr:unnamed protein product [Ceutorhynchus assimilis]
MNINLLKTFTQNSKCNKFLNNIFFQDVLCTKNTATQYSTFLAPQKKLFASQISSFDTFSKRCYCQQQNEEKRPTPSHKLPPLMEFPIIVWPSLLKSIKNLILTTLIIKPYLDEEFSLPDFIQGSKKAVEVVSHKISDGQDLEGLVAAEIIPALQEKVSKMTLGQRDLIPIKADDVYFSFPYQIGIMFDQDGSEAQKRFVEITMVYHVMRGLSRMRSQGEEPPINMGLLPEYQDRLSICNYRFIKEFTKGVDSDWTINLLNQFRPIDDEF